MGANSPSPHASPIVKSPLKRMQFSNPYVATKNVERPAFMMSKPVEAKEDPQEKPHYMISEATLEMFDDRAESVN